MRKTLPFFIAVLLVAGFAWGLWRLFSLRFARGNVYPASSTLRADPLGARAFYESLAELMPVERNHRPFRKLRAEGATVFVLGLEPMEERPAEDFEEMELVTRQGARLVVTFRPVVSDRSKGDEELDGKSKEAVVEKTKSKAPQQKQKNAKKDKTEEEKKEERETRWEPFGKRWGFKVGWAKKIEPAKAAGAGLEPGLSWHSKMFFEEVNPKFWRVFYTSGGKPVVIERDLGRGSLVLAADSYFTSNEALLNERRPKLLAWLVGPGTRAIFDETHLGVADNPGMATLARKYRLHGVVAVLLLLAVLHVWRSAASFLPPAEERRADDGVIAGRDAASGFVNILRRNIAPRDVITAGVAEWKRSFAHRVDPQTLARIETLAANSAEQPLAAYQAIARVLSEKGKVRSKQ
jgi:hypothetical protein